MNKRKQASREERRRESVELNLVAPSQERGPLGRARRGCTFPFLGGSLLVVIFMVLVHLA